MNSQLESMGVTTSQSQEHLISTAVQISQELGVPYISRANKSIKKLQDIYNLKYLIVIREDRIQVSFSDHEFFFHPGLSLTRLRSWKTTGYDSMIEAMKLEEGDSLLDCTLGLANDAIVSSYVSGAKGKIVGLESSPLIYIITKYGLKNYKKGSKEFQQAMKNIEVIWTNYCDYLKRIPAKSFDIVYFDPMFKNPLIKSSGIKNLRYLANQQDLDEEILNWACKIARKRVVIKNLKYSNKFTQLKVDKVSGGKYSNIAFGIIFTKENG